MTMARVNPTVGLASEPKYVYDRLKLNQGIVKVIKQRGAVKRRIYYIGAVSGKRRELKATTLRSLIFRRILSVTDQDQTEGSTTFTLNPTLYSAGV